MSDVLLDAREVSKRTSLSRNHIYRLMRTGDFPRPVKIGPVRVAWVEGEVEKWVADRVRERGRKG